MGTRQEELEASVQLIWEYATEACKEDDEQRPEIEYGKKLVLASPKLLRVLEAIREDVGYGGGGVKLSPHFLQMVNYAIREAT